MPKYGKVKIPLDLIMISYGKGIQETTTWLIQKISECYNNAYKPSISANERTVLIGYGWIDEGIAGFPPDITSSIRKNAAL